MREIRNKKAYYDYEILEKLEAGILLAGAEVKAIRNGRISLEEGYVALDENNDAWLYNVIISRYQFASKFDLDPARPRKLLINKNEAISLNSKMKSRKGSIIPIRVYSKGRNIKVEIALARGKRKYEKKLREKERTIAHETHVVSREFGRK